MKKFILYPILLLLLLVLGLLVTVFINPTLLINPKNLNYVLTKTQVLKSWKWEHAEINHEWIKWNERKISGGFKNFCFVYDHISIEVSTCLDEFSWDAVVSTDPEYLAPIKIYSSETKILLKETPEEENTPTEPPPVWKYWQMLWANYVPPLDIHFKNILVLQKESELKFDFSLSKTRNELLAEAMDFKLWADHSRIELTGPKAYPLPGDPPTKRPLYLRDFKLVAQMSEKLIPVDITGLLEIAKFHITSEVKLPITEDPKSIPFLRKVILATKGNVTISEIQKNLKRYAPSPFDALPAPINAMDGVITLDVKSVKGDDPESVFVSGDTRIDLAGKTQALKLGLVVNTPINLNDFSPGPISVAIDLEKVLLQLPRLSKKSAPPQFFPDSRIQIKEPEKTKPKEKNESNLSLMLEALGKNALHLRTDLLDEALRINFKLLVDKGELKDGFVDILPLKTTVFKRPIEVPGAKIKFQAPLEPTLDASIVFKLPEYIITMVLEGPLSKPRYAFSSEPPLPQNDIYAVLLFGRPLADLDPDSKAAASRTNMMLTQGILSLSVLYFLAGSPVEYVGYDPESGEASAQIGLGAKTSLRVGAGQGGSTSTGVRRSLGKGWYLDTSVQNTQGTSNSDTKDYGVLLERIIAY